MNRRQFLSSVASLGVSAALPTSQLNHSVSLIHCLLASRLTAAASRAMLDLLAAIRLAESAARIETKAMIYIQDSSAHDCYGPFPSEYDAHEFAANREISAYQMLTQDDIDNEHLIERGYVRRPR